MQRPNDFQSLLQDAGRRRGHVRHGERGSLELRAALVRPACRLGGRGGRRNVHAPSRGRLAPGHDGHHRSLRLGRRATAHDLSGGNTGIRQSGVPHTLRSRTGPGDRRSIRTFRTLVLGDGAADNWSFLSPLTDRQLVDFYHASEYVGKASAAMFPGKKRAKERAAWLEDRLHRLKHKQGAASRLLEEMEESDASRTIRGRQLLAGLKSAITYFRNHKPRMNYSYHTARCQPIGSGVTEAACKVLIKQRFCKSGSRWKEQGASAVLSIRSLKLTPGRWSAFWRRISQYGYAYQPA